MSEIDSARLATCIRAIQRDAMEKSGVFMTPVAALAALKGDGKSQLNSQDLANRIADIQRDAMEESGVFMTPVAALATLRDEGMLAPKAPVTEPPKGRLFMSALGIDGHVIELPEHWKLGDLIPR